jgi:hypothetical protein
MCWSETTSLAMVGIGAAAAVVTARQGRPLAVPVAFGYFAVMEALQAAGYRVIDQCDSPANQTITFLSILHIVFQPFVINAFAMALVVGGVRVRTQVVVYGFCALASVTMLLQLYPFDWAGSCRPGDILCGEHLCTRSGEWHLAWDVPFNGLLVPFDTFFGTRWSFPAYMLAVFLMPLFYGAWRFCLFHALVGPMLAGWLTQQPNEVPAIWCLFSIGIIVIGLSPWMWRRFGIGGRRPA